MRLPNGYGSVTKLSGKRRRPWMVRKTLGYDEETGSQIMQVIGYYATRSEAISALTLYNQNPYDIDARRITFAEVYDKWSDRRYEEMTHENILAYTRAFKRCEEIHAIPFHDLRAAHLQGMLDHHAPNDSAKVCMKRLFSQLYQYALMHEIADKNYASFCESVAVEVQDPHTPFTPEEIQVLWDHVDDMPKLSSVLVLIYTGMRIAELLDIKSEDVHLDERYMVGGLKTRAGKNRIIPINRKIEPFIRSYLAQGNTYLFPSLKGKHMGYSSYINQIWEPMLQLPGISEHRTHDCRHTFVSMLDSSKANKVCIKRIIGHSTKDVTEGVYTHKSLTELLETIDLI